MKYLLLLLSSLFCFPLTGKNQKEALYATRAVVIGVSDYQDDQITDLKNRASMALAFTAYLKSKAGGNLADENIRLLINEKATSGQMQAAVDWLTTIERKGDRIIFYFAGYGNLQNIAPFDTPSMAYQSNLFPFAPLKKLLTKLERTNMSEVIIILDVQDLDSELEKQKQTQIINLKKEASGASHEIFISKSKNHDSNSRHRHKKKKEGMTDLFLNALFGRADYNDDKKVSLAEVRNYLLTNPDTGSIFNAQFYIYANTFLRPLSEVNEITYTQLKKDPLKMLPPLVYLESDDFENAVLKKESQAVRDLYQDFVVALRLGNFLAPKNLSADTRYNQILNENISVSLRKSMKRKYIAALQDESQQAINSYLKSDPNELALRWKYSDKYARFPLYLEKAANLTGEGHFMYDRLRAKQFYFEGISQRLDASKNGKENSNYDIALIRQKQALKYEAEAAFIYNEIGLIYYLMGAYDEAVVYYLQAVELSPGWSIPYSNMAVAFSAQKNLIKAKEYCEKAIKINPDYSAAYNNLGTIYLKSGACKLAENNFKKAISLFPDAHLPYYNMSCSKAIQGKKGQACKWMERAFKNGFDRFDELQKDPDLENIRSSSRFNNLIQRYQ